MINFKKNWLYIWGFLVDSFGHRPLFCPGQRDSVCTSRRWFCWTRIPVVSPRTSGFDHFLGHTPPHHIWKALQLLWPEKRKINLREDIQRAINLPYNLRIFGKDILQYRYLNIQNICTIIHLQGKQKISFHFENKCLPYKLVAN